jgi:hypothetical protein
MKRSPSKTLILISCLVFLISCAHSRGSNELSKSLYEVRFEKPLVVKTKTLDKEPSEIRDKILHAIFLFEHEEYKESAEMFLEAAGEIKNPNELRKLTLEAAAVAQLLANARKGFIKTIEELKRSINKYERRQDERFKVLERLYEKIKNQQEIKR